MQITIHTVAGDGKNQSDDTVIVDGQIFNESSKQIITEKYSIVSVCDGVGGNAGAKRASIFVCDALSKHVFYGEKGEQIKKFFEHLNDELLAYAENFLDEKDMATTCTSIIYNGQKLFLVHIGNCRLYKMQGKYLKQITSDQTVHQLLMNSAAFEEAAITENHAIYACLGGGASVYVKPLLVKSLDESLLKTHFLLTSDGVHDYLIDEELERIINGADNDVLSAEKIISKATQNGSKDDCSIVIIRS